MSSTAVCWCHAHSLWLWNYGKDLDLADRRGCWIRRIYFTSSGKCLFSHLTTSVTLVPVEEWTLCLFTEPLHKWLFFFFRFCCCCCCCPALFGGYWLLSLLTQKGQKLQPRHAEMYLVIQTAQCQPKASERWPDKAYFKVHKPFRIYLQYSDTLYERRSVFGSRSKN